MNLEAKDDLIKVIQNNAYKFSKGQKIIAQFIIEHYDKAAFMTAAKIGQTVDVSESTVVRFASALGFDGFPELQEALQVMIKNKLTIVQRISLDKGQDDSEEFIKKIFRNEINSLKNCLDELDESQLKKAAELIFNARKIYILGMRVSYTLALYLGFYLDVMLENVKILDFGSNSLFEQMIRMNEEDLFIIISYPRYSKQSLDAVAFAKERNAKIIAITDTESSPFYPLSDLALLGKSNMVSFIDSLVTPLAVINSLILTVGMQEKNDILKYFDLLEEVWDKYSIYSKSTDELGKRNR